MSASWRSTREVGTALGVRILVVSATLFGRAVPRLMLPFIAAYFTLLNGRARAASRSYLERIGEPHGILAVFRHFLRFAQCTLDRLFFLRRDVARFRVSRTGHHHLAEARRSGTGAILLGAHLGSFEAMRAGADDDAVPVNVLGYFRNAAMINAFLDAAGPNSGPRFIDLGESPVGTALRVRERVARGEFVAILADRFDGGPSARVDFLGGKADFPTGPYALAAALGCPVYLTFGLHRAPDCYDLYCEPFAERIVAPRASRQFALAEYAQRYAGRLEHFCRMQPDNWFNFFEFWGQADGG